MFLVPTAFVGQIAIPMLGRESTLRIRGDASLLQRFFLTVALAFIASSAAHARFFQDDFYFPNGDNARYFLTIGGAITSELADKVRALEARGAKPYGVALDNSPGGDVEAAMEIGRVLRKHQVRASVDGDCASACVLILAAGVMRDFGPRGRIGLHRPYFMSSHRDYANAQQRVVKLNAAIHAYLSEMNVTPTLLDVMNSVPSDQIKFVSEDGARRVGLVEVDPVFEEFLDGQRAAKLGLTRPAYNAVKAKWREQCKPLDFHDKKYCACIDRIGMRAPGDSYPCDN